MRGQGFGRWVGCGSVALLAACTTVAPPPAPPPVAAPAAAVVRRSAVDAAALATFEQRQRQRAAQAASQGRWVDAQFAWDVVLALAPGDEEALQRRREAAAAARAGVDERLPRARQARQRGDLDGATRLYLEALALDPARTEAADALREIELERVRRNPRAGVAAGAAAMREAPARRATVVPAPLPPPGALRMELEHASMLARQGDVDAAIAQLAPVAGDPRADPAARALMADLYWQQAQRLAASDRAGAIAALERCLRLAPSHPQARALLRELRPVNGNPAPAPATRPRP